MRPATPDLARRWLAALLLVPEAERAGVVSEVEKRIVSIYGHLLDANRVSFQGVLKAQRATNARAGATPHARPTSG